MDFKAYCSYFDITELEPTIIGKKYYLLSDRQKELDTKTDKDLAYGGVFLGEERGKRFSPSLMFLDIASKHTDKKVVIKRDAEFLFLCGRDILGKSVYGEYAYPKDTLVLVLNEHDECLGMGEVIRRFDLKDKVVIKNILDRGDFLRREKKK